MTEETLFMIGDWLMLISIVATAVFIASYGIFFAWRRTPAGKSLMYVALSLLAWEIQTFVSRMDPDYTGRALIRVIVYALVAVTVWRLVVTLWRSWKHTPFEVEPRKKE